MADEAQITAGLQFSDYYSIFEDNCPRNEETYCT